MTSSPEHTGDLHINLDIVEGGDTDTRPQVKGTRSTSSNLSSQVAPMSNNSPDEPPTWQGIHMLSDSPITHVFLSNPNSDLEVLQQTNDDSSEKWAGLSQTLDKPIFTTPSENQYEGTWSGISASLHPLRHQGESRQGNARSMDNSEWSGLSGHLEQPLQPTFLGLSTQFLGRRHQAGEDMSEQVEVEKNPFWGMSFFEENVLTSTPQKDKRREDNDAPSIVHLELDDAYLDRETGPRYYRTKELSNQIDTLLGQIPRTKHRPAGLLDLQKLVRERTKELIRDKTDVPTVTGYPALFPTRFEVERYASTKDPAYGPSITAFRIELSEKCRTPWNKRLAVVFTDDFITSGKHGYTNNDHSKIVDVFLTHLKTLRSRFLLSSEGDIPQTQFDEEKARARDARRRSLFQRRINACKYYIDDASIKNFLEILKDLNYKVCSGDESAHDRGKLRYVILQPKWRNPQLHFHFRILDRLHLSTRITQPEHRFTRGAAPRVRVTADRVDHSDAIPGLPQNFYCPIYLSGLPKYKRDALKIQPPREIFVSEEIKRVADEHARLTSVETPALPDHGLVNSPFFFK